MSVTVTVIDASLGGQLATIEVEGKNVRTCSGDPALVRRILAYIDGKTFLVFFRLDDGSDHSARRSAALIIGTKRPLAERVVAALTDLPVMLDDGTVVIGVSDWGWDRVSPGKIPEFRRQYGGDQQ